MSSSSSSSGSSFGDSECDERRGEISGIKNWKTIGFICMRVLLCINEPLLFKNCRVKDYHHVRFG
jgi:hypothetical protein